jgi:hypothetical protein
MSISVVLKYSNGIFVFAPDGTQFNYRCMIKIGDCIRCACINKKGLHQLQIPVFQKDMICFVDLNMKYVLLKLVFIVHVI